MVNLDADDPVDDSDSDSGDSDDDTAMLMAELQKIKSEKAMEEAEKVSLGSVYKKTGGFLNFFCNLLNTASSASA